MDPIREKKHRLPREAYQGQVTVNITACINERKMPFYEANIVQTFLNKLEQAAHKHRCLIVIYCFMPDHLHLLVHGIDHTADTWRTMVDFKQQTGYWFARERNEFSWQKDFHDHIIRSNKDLAAHIRYIANNPVRRGLVADWHEYPFTGAVGIDLHQVMADTATL